MNYLCVFVATLYAMTPNPIQTDVHQQVNGLQIYCVTKFEIMNNHKIWKGSTSLS